jgi:hypothetical protein
MQATIHDSHLFARNTKVTQTYLLDHTTQRNQTPSGKKTNPEDYFMREIAGKFLGWDVQVIFWPDWAVWTKYLTIATLEGNINCLQ